MGTINVRQLDDEVVHGLKRRAAGNNRSLEGEVRQILRSAVEEDMVEKRAAFRILAERLQRESRGKVYTPGEILIREDRDSGHREI